MAAYMMDGWLSKIIKKPSILIFFIIYWVVHKYHNNINQWQLAAVYLT